MVPILLVAHEGIGEALLAIAQKVLAARLADVEVVSIPLTDDLSRYEALLHRAIARLDQGDGVLMLADLIGASPCNLASAELDANVRLVTGLNLSMLLKVLNHRQLSLDDLASRALRGGREGVVEIAAGCT
jgi:mannose PTS system EIIA component